MSHARRHITRRGFSMVEAVICIGLVGVALVAAMRTVGASARAQAITTRQAAGHMLAQELMAEILAQEYDEPDGFTLLLTDIGDVASDRTTYDDVDDFDRWSASPPQTRDQIDLTDYTGWTREVDVDMVSAADLDGDPLLVIGDTGVKRIVVRVYAGDLLAAELRAVKTAAWTRGEVADE